MALAAAIDIGTNSVRLLVADFREGQLFPVVSALAITRLGRGVAEMRLLSPEARAETVEAAAEFCREAREKGAEKILAVATSAVREAKNADVFLRELEEATGLRARVLAGEEEAFLSYAGALVGLEKGKTTFPVVVADVGGGSTELIYPQEGRIFARSYPLGAVRYTEKELAEEEIASFFWPLRREILKLAPFELVGVGGTITALAAIERGLATYLPAATHGARLRREVVERLLAFLSFLSSEERRRVPGLSPGREDIIVAGARIWKVLLRVLEVEELTVSEAGLLHGLLCSYFRGNWEES